MSRERRPEIHGTRLVHDGWNRLIIADVTLPGGERVERAMEDHGRAVCVLPYDPERRLALLVQQFRAPPFHADGTRDLLEAPAGILDAQDAEAEARREAMEEVGLRLGPLERVVAGWSMPGVSTERIDLFLGAYAAGDRVGAGGGLAAEHEDITVVEMPLAELAARCDRGAITDLKTFALAQTLRLRRPDLF
jgi:nudix-type nucleoside diphosphatase (YffH/AdpP family)